MESFSPVTQGKIIELVGSNITECIRLNGCGGDEVYKITSSQESVVVKKLRPDYAFTENELKCTIWASDNQVGPKLYGHDNYELVMEYLAGVMASDGCLISSIELTKHMKYMHSVSTNTDTGINREDFVSRSYSVFLEERQQAVLTPVPKCMLAMFEYVDAVMKELKGSPVAICHNDLHLRNIMKSKEDCKLRFIDFPFTGPDYILIDIAQTAALLQDEPLDSLYEYCENEDEEIIKLFKRVIPLPYAYRVCFPLIGLKITPPTTWSIRSSLFLEEKEELGSSFRDVSLCSPPELRSFSEEYDILYEKGDFPNCYDYMMMLNDGQLDLTTEDTRIKFSLSMLKAFYVWATE